MSIKFYRNPNWYGLNETKIYADGSWATIKPTDKMYFDREWRPVGRTVNWLVSGYNGPTCTSDRGFVYSSTDAQYNDSGLWLFKIAFNGEMWVGAGFGGMWYSYDGVDWTRSDTWVFHSLAYGVAWNGGMWVAVGNADSTSSVYTSTVASSTDGINWTGNGSPFHLDGGGNAVAWNGEMWVAVGSQYFSTTTSTSSGYTIATSTDGITWTNKRNPFSSNYDAGIDVAWNGEMWVVVGNGICTSPDGTTWTEQTNPLGTFVRGIAWNGELWVAVGDGADEDDSTIATSPDGIAWTTRGNPFSATTGYAVAWNGEMWIAVGGQKNSPFIENAIATSTDGITWTARGNPFNGGCGSCVCPIKSPNLYPAIT